MAERAGVQRATVYRHFPDEGAFFAACSAHWLKRHDPPDAAPWAAIADPDERPARRAWRDVPLLPRGRADDGKRAPRRGVRRDARVPAAADARLVAAIAGLVLEGRPERGRRRTRVAAALAHAVDFEAWRSLARGGLDDEEIVELMVVLVRAAGAPRGKLP